MEQLPICSLKQKGLDDEISDPCEGGGGMRRMNVGYGLEEEKRRRDWPEEIHP